MSNNISIKSKKYNDIEIIYENKDFIYPLNKLKEYYVSKDNLLDNTDINNNINIFDTYTPAMRVICDEYTRSGVYLTLNENNIDSYPIIPNELKDSSILHSYYPIYNNKILSTKKIPNVLDVKHYLSSRNTNDLCILVKYFFNSIKRVPFEPLFASICLYTYLPDNTVLLPTNNQTNTTSISSNNFVRISEVHYWDLTPPNIRYKYPFIYPTNILDDNKFLHHQSYGNKPCVFTIPKDIPKEDIFVIVQISKILTSTNDLSILPYTKNNSSSIDDSKHIIACQRLSNYRQTIGYGILKVFNDQGLCGQHGGPNMSVPIIASRNNINEYQLGQVVRELHPNNSNTVSNKSKLEYLDIELICSIYNIGDNKLDLSIPKSITSHTEIENSKIIKSTDYYLPISQIDNSTSSPTDGLSIIKLKTLLPVGLPSANEIIRQVYTEKENVMYIYPILLDCFTHRNLCIEIEIIEFNQPIKSNNYNQPYTVLTNISNTLTFSPSLINKIYTTVYYHNKSPNLLDEIKVYLPDVITTQHFLRFTANHIHVKEKFNRRSTGYLGGILGGKEKELEPSSLVLGYGYLPLLTNGVSLVADKEYDIKISTNTKTDSDIQPYIRIYLKCLSSFTSTCPVIQSMLQYYPHPIGYLPSSIYPVIHLNTDKSIDISSQLLKTTNNLVINSLPNEMNKFFLLIFRYLYRNLCLNNSISKDSNQLKSMSFLALVQLFSLTCGETFNNLNNNPTSSKSTNSDIQTPGEILLYNYIIILFDEEEYINDNDYTISLSDNHMDENLNEHIDITIDSVIDNQLYRKINDNSFLDDIIDDISNHFTVQIEKLIIQSLLDDVTNYVTTSIHNHIIKSSSQISNNELNKFELSKHYIRAYTYQLTTNEKTFFDLEKEFFQTIENGGYLSNYLSKAEFNYLTDQVDHSNMVTILPFMCYYNSVQNIYISNYLNKSLVNNPKSFTTALSNNNISKSNYSPKYRAMNRHYYYYILTKEWLSLLTFINIPSKGNVLTSNGKLTLTIDGIRNKLANISRFLFQLIIKSLYIYINRNQLQLPVQLDDSYINVLVQLIEKLVNEVISLIVYNNITNARKLNSSLGLFLKQLMTICVPIQINRIINSCLNSYSSDIQINRSLIYELKLKIIHEILQINELIAINMPFTNDTPSNVISQYTVDLSSSSSNDIAIDSDRLILDYYSLVGSHRSNRYVDEVDLESPEDIIISNQPVSSDDVKATNESHSNMDSIVNNHENTVELTNNDQKSLDVNIDNELTNQIIDNKVDTPSIDLNHLDAVSDSTSETEHIVDTIITNDENDNQIGIQIEKVDSQDDDISDVIRQFSIETSDDKLVGKDSKIHQLIETILNELLNNLINDHLDSNILMKENPVTNNINLFESDTSVKAKGDETKLLNENTTELETTLDSDSFIPDSNQINSNEPIEVLDINVNTCIRSNDITIVNTPIYSPSALTYEFKRVRNSSINLFTDQIDSNSNKDFIYPGWLLNILIKDLYNSVKTNESTIQQFGLKILRNYLIKLSYDLRFYSIDHSNKLLYQNRINMMFISLVVSIINDSLSISNNSFDLPQRKDILIIFLSIIQFLSNKIIRYIVQHLIRLDSYIFDNANSNILLHSDQQTNSQNSSNNVYNFLMILHLCLDTFELPTNISSNSTNNQTFITSLLSNDFSNSIKSIDMIDCCKKLSLTNSLLIFDLIQICIEELIDQYWYKSSEDNRFNSLLQFLSMINSLLLHGLYTNTENTIVINKIYHISIYLLHINSYPIYEQTLSNIINEWIYRSIYLSYHYNYDCCIDYIIELFQCNYIYYGNIYVIKQLFTFLFNEFVINNIKSLINNKSNDLTIKLFQNLNNYIDRSINYLNSYVNKPNSYNNSNHLMNELIELYNNFKSIIYINISLFKLLNIEKIYFYDFTGYDNNISYNQTTTSATTNSTNSVYSSSLKLSNDITIDVFNIIEKIYFIITNVINSLYYPKFCISWLENIATLYDYLGHKVEKVFVYLSIYQIIKNCQNHYIKLSTPRTLIKWISRSIDMKPSYISSERLFTSKPSNTRDFFQVLTNHLNNPPTNPWISLSIYQRDIINILKKSLSILSSIGYIDYEEVISKELLNFYLSNGYTNAAAEEYIRIGQSMKSALESGMNKFSVGSYYRVFFTGEGLPDHLRDSHYVYRDGNNSHISEFQMSIKLYLTQFIDSKFELIITSDSSYLPHQYSGKRSSMPPTDSNNANASTRHIYAVITAIKPIDNITIKDLSIYQPINKFSYEIPFTKTGKSHSSRIDEQYKRKITLSVEYGFPSIFNRQLVTNQIIKTLSPIEVAIDDINERINDMNKLLDIKISNDLSILREMKRIVQGSILPQVNAGTAEVAKVFLSNITDDCGPSHGDLKNTLHKFLAISNKLLQRTKEFIDRIKSLSDNINLNSITSNSSLLTSNIQSSNVASTNNANANHDEVNSVWLDEMKKAYQILYDKLMPLIK